MELTVNLGKESYSIYVEPGILRNAELYISHIFKGKRMMIISDDHVYPLYGESLIKALSSYECHSLVLPHGELTKSFQTLPQIYKALLEEKISRSDLVIALGGGVIGDLAGFAAASYLRGVMFVQIPTSLLAQVDSSVGGKVAVDLPQGKNLVGAFYHPRLVLVDPETLDTLPERYITDGMGEVIKYGCIRDEALFNLLNSHTSFADLKSQLTSIICRCIDIKRFIVEADQFDTGERMLLNFGHTLGHTIEQYYHYKRESHGEAVAIGMYQITKIAEKAGLTPTGQAEKIYRILKTYGLPYECGLPVSVLTDAIKLDKKNLDGRLNVVLLHKIGDSYVYPTSLDFFKTDGII
ncbi:3-dehydroquinate synthase [Clostridium sp. C105KSO13]|uniref:3-dehydroquinate synthase n=1 Tax=Clostridium sp. C105KSO13 TaxID=1776045 RepID=UPI0007406104|nr:3-dehydroquinate synthase [Clostridium sp. C105KSO13]CUX31109.1 3-dehydroquinate synthase [Clostridium sp. C105KSO13]